MRLRLTLLLLFSMIASPVAADTRYLAYNPADRLTTALTRGITLEIERGLFGAISVRRIISTSARGAAGIEKGGPDGARRVLPDGPTQTSVYSIDPGGDGRGLARALCPGAEATYLVVGRVQAGRPMAIQATGRWPDGQFRHCVTLSYDYRGEWSLPPRSPPPETP